MKKLFLLFSFALFSMNIANSQRTQSESIENLKSDILNIETDYLDVNIQTWNKDYIEVKSKVSINAGREEDKHDLQVDNSRNGIVIKSSIDTEAIDKLVIITDNEGNKSYIPYDDWDENLNGKDFASLNLGYEIDGALTIFVPEDMSLAIQTVYGDVYVNGDYSQIETHSTYGLVEAKLEDISKMSRINLKSTYDIVDLTLDKNSNASLNLNTSYGSVFTDLPLKSKQSGHKKINHGCSQVSERYVLNNGDTNIDIVATYDNIYVRSK